MTNPELHARQSLQESSLVHASAARLGFLGMIRSCAGVQIS